MTTPTEEPTLRALLRRRELALELTSAPDALPPDALDRPIKGVHSSDLLDPTPFLSEGLALLTTGTQFADVDDEAYAPYVARLRARGVAALGFGTEVVREGVPAPLATACAEAGIALFVVPYDTPFIAVARANAQALAAQEYARRSWALDAQRALSLAALRSDGLGEMLGELARRLDAWVGLFDAVGELSHEFPSGTLPPGMREPLREEVATVLARGTRAGASVPVSGRQVVLQTLGRGGHLRGVLAVAGADLDAEARAVVTLAVAMAGLALEQRRSLTRGLASLRAGLLASILTGDAATARRVAREMWGGLPSGTLRVAVADGAVGRRRDVVEWLEAQTEGHGDRLFFGTTDGELVLVVPEGGLASVRQTAERFALAIGVSDPVTEETLASGVAQARFARERGGTGVTEFSATRGRLLRTLVGEPARLVAAAELAPLRSYDRDHAAQLEPTLRTWLEHDASHERAAAALGVHRHTIRARLETVERVLGCDLGSFHQRAELWFALQASA